MNIRDVFTKIANNDTLNETDKIVMSDWLNSIDTTSSRASIKYVRDAYRVVTNEFKYYGDGLFPDSFTGIVIGYPAVTIGSSDYYMATLSSGTVQVGITSTGTLSAGTGIVTLDSNGISIEAASTDSTTNAYRITKSGELLGYLASYQTATMRGIYLSVDQKASRSSSIVLQPTSPLGATLYSQVSLYAQNGTTWADLYVIADSLSNSMVLNLDGVNTITANATQIVMNAGNGDTDTVLKGDTATNLLVADAGLDAVRIGTTAAGVIADFRATSIVFNEASGDIDFRVETNTYDSITSDAGNDSIQLMSNAAGKVGFLGAAPVVQHAHIVDATNATDVITTCNHILSVLEEYGLLATS